MTGICVDCKQNKELVPISQPGGTWYGLCGDCMQARINADQPARLPDVLPDADFYGA